MEIDVKHLNNPDSARKIHLMLRDLVEIHQQIAILADQQKVYKESAKEVKKVLKQEYGIPGDVINEVTSAIATNTVEEVQTTNESFDLLVELHQNNGKLNSTEAPTE